VQIENDDVRVTVLVEGGHIAEILHKPAGVNALWTPPWPSIEPSEYRRETDKTYGANAESKLLAGIMGHNVCLDLFGPPSDEESQAGMTVHGEAPIAPFSIDASAQELSCATVLPAAQIRYDRRIRLEGGDVLISESVENAGLIDRPIAWTQHVTLGPPFLERGKTEFRVSATKSKAHDAGFGNLFPSGVEFEWPVAPKQSGEEYDLRRFTDGSGTSAYTAHLMDPSKEEAFFVAWSPASRVAFGYRWKRSDFPWMGMWEENEFRSEPPWNTRTIARGMEFGVSPIPERRRDTVDRGELFGVRCYRWLPARTRIRVEYSARIFTASECPESL
jgi:hypothetical protein